MKQLINSRFPGTYQYFRKLYLNSSNHLIWIIRRFNNSVNEQHNDPYNKEFWTLTENWDYESFARVLTSHFNVSSILDVGCGSGTILSAFHRVNGNLRLLGMDNSPVALGLAQKRGLEVRQLNVVKCSNRDIYSLCEQLGSFQITMCLEVAEHLPFWQADKLLKILIGTSDTVVFSAAPPGQGGTLHLNEQPPEYWIRKFSTLKYAYNKELSAAIREELQGINIPSWYKNNLLVFHRA
jgi:SAM-dependent methyltransferase